jgi:asparagine synthase (glutamine-hydrolysing)
MTTDSASLPPSAAADLAHGHPRFADALLARLARDSGSLAAWRQALAAARDEAAITALMAGVRGDFNVGVTLPDGRVFLAVDRFAVHSVCWRVAGGGLRFAPRADALAAADGDAGIDPQAVFDYLFFHCIPSPRTIFSGVQRVPPGHCALWDGRQMKVWRYWMPQFQEPQGPVSFDGLKAEFRQHLQQAVAERLDGGKAACFLSGGTDSSTVAGLIGQVSGRPAATYSIGFEAEGYDEMAFARIAAKAFGTEHHEYYVTPADLVKSIATVAASYDQPFGNSSALPAYYCALQARGDGVTRMLAGDGGDELFGGNSRYAKQRVFDWYAHVPAGLRRGLMEPFFQLGAVARTPLLKKGSSYIEQARVPMPDRLQMYNLLLRLGTQEVLTPAFLARVNPRGPLEHQRGVWNEVAEEASTLNRTLAYDWRYTLGESDLPKVCGTTRLAGLEVAFPMLDDALLDFSLRLPTEYKLKGLKLRWFFKEALRGFLPDEIIAKKKQGFGLPFGVWLTRHPALMTLARDSLASLAPRGIVRPAFVQELFERRLAEHPSYYGEMVWILMMLEQWLQGHAPGLRID